VVASYGTKKYEFCHFDRNIQLKSSNKLLLEQLDSDKVLSPNKENFLFGNINNVTTLITIIV